MHRLMIALSLLVLALVPATTAGSATLPGVRRRPEVRHEPERRRGRAPRRTSASTSASSIRTHSRATPPSFPTGARAPCADSRVASSSRIGRPRDRPRRPARPGASTASTSALCRSRHLHVHGHGRRRPRLRDRHRHPRDAHRVRRAAIVHGFDDVAAARPHADDCHGHGTHVAGTVGGTTYGVAKGVTLRRRARARLRRHGLNSAVIAGVDWVTGNHRRASRRWRT